MEKVVDPLIYFLIDVNNEVVYVGKTLHGYSRPFAHINDKVFEKKLQYLNAMNLSLIT